MTNNVVDDYEKEIERLKRLMEEPSNAVQKLNRSQALSPSDDNSDLMFLELGKSNIEVVSILERLLNKVVSIEKDLDTNTTRTILSNSGKWIEGIFIETITLHELAFIE